MKIPSNAMPRVLNRSAMSPHPSAAQPSCGPAFAVAAVMACAAVLSYLGSFQVPFLFDDGPAIVENASIRDLSRIGDVLLPTLEGGVTTSGRPVLNLSYAINHALGGYDPVGYHVVNLVIHYLAALVLFGIVRRTIHSLEFNNGENRALLMAAVVATLWMLHPLQTSAVTYLSQRAESLCGLFYLLTVYTFIRASKSSCPWRWSAASIIACALGMGTKEVMVSAPVLVLLYDRTFVAGSFAAAWARRGKYYALLAGTWSILVALAAGSSGRGTTAGFETVVAPWDYLLTQCSAIVHYLRLAFWPCPLVFDYGTATVGSLASVSSQAVLLTCLASAVLWALVKRPVWGFLGAWFFAILAPSSSFVPVASQTVAEHRMYLPLAAVIVVVVVTAKRCIRSVLLYSTVMSGIAVVLGAVTTVRNEDFSSVRSIWEDTVDKMPENPRAHINLALVLASSGSHLAALDQLDMALTVEPSSADAHYNRGVLLSKLGQTLEAEAAYQAAVRIQPNHAEALNNLGNHAHKQGNRAAAEAFYRGAMAARTGYAAPMENLSALALDAGDADEAILHAEAALRADPNSAGAAFRLGNALLEKGRAQDAIRAFERAVHLDRDHADAHNNLANLFVEFDQLEPALSHYQQVIVLRPEMIQPRRNAAIILAQFGRTAEAIEQLEALTRLAPGDPTYREQLALLRQHSP